jgi:hypothetical protein
VKASVCLTEANFKRISPHSKNALRENYENENMFCDDNESFNILNDTFLIRFIYNDKSARFIPDFIHSELNENQYEVIMNDDAENYCTKKNLKKLFTTFAKRIKKNAGSNPKYKVALKWMRQYTGLEK